MKKKYTVLHIGYPIAGRPIREDEWKVFSSHTTESAAWKVIKKNTSHLDYGSWDDHYKVVGPNGTCDYQEFYYGSMNYGKR